MRQSLLIAVSPAETRVCKLCPWFLTAGAAPRCGSCICPCGLVDDRHALASLDPSMNEQVNQVFRIVREAVCEFFEPMTVLADAIRQFFAPR